MRQTRHAVVAAEGVAVYNRVGQAVGFLQEGAADPEQNVRLLILHVQARQDAGMHEEVVAANGGQGQGPEPGQMLPGHRQQVRIAAVPLPQFGRRARCVLGQGIQKHLLVAATQHRHACAERLSCSSATSSITLRSAPGPGARSIRSRRRISSAPLPRWGLDCSLEEGGAAVHIADRHHRSHGLSRCHHRHPTR
jgi:hypothetical protein